MDDNSVLEALKSFLVKNVASKIKLEKPPEQNHIDGDYELVNPAVYVGWMPPKNDNSELPYDEVVRKYIDDYGYSAPVILVIQDGGNDDGEESSIDIRLGVITYDPGLRLEGTTIYANKGYKDLLNLITLIRTEFAKVSCIEDKTTIKKPIRWQIHTEQPYPYWNASIMFQCSIVPLNLSNVGIEKFL